MALRMILLMLIVMLVVLITSCGSAPRQPDLPGAELLVSPSLVTMERRHYVPVPDYLTETEPVAMGEIAECFAVAAQRRAALEQTNARLRAIAVIQGTEVTP